MVDKKVGILTFHNSRNYGAVLQAYALQRYLLRYCSQVKIIDYRNEKIENVVRLWEWSNIKNTIRTFFSFFFRLKKKLAFDWFLKDKNIITKQVDKLYLKEFVKDYDVLIVGSDQVWNVRIMGGDLSYFLDFVQDDVEKIAYAASFGDDDLIIDEVQVELLKRFQLVSLREKRNMEELQKKLGQQIYHFCDPVMLLSQEEWMQVKSTFVVKKPYIFLFVIEQSDRLNQYVEMLAEKRGLKIINSKNSIDFWKKISPSDFINWIVNAEYVVTNSFHATVFSLIFHKKFAYAKYRNGNKKIKVRIVELLEALQLEKRHVENNDFQIEEEIDWDKIDTYLQKMSENTKENLLNLSIQQW